MPDPLGGETDSATRACDVAVRELAAAEGAVVARRARFLAARTGRERLRHFARMTLARHEARDAVERLSMAVRWLVDLGDEGAVDRYGDEMMLRVRESRARAGAWPAGDVRAN